METSIARSDGLATEATTVTLFSMSALPVSLESVLRTARVVRGIEAREKNVLYTKWEELDGALPDGGFPKGLIELEAPHGLGGGASVALSAIAALQAGHAESHAAWVESPGARLSAPALLSRGVDLGRLFVVRADAASPRELLSRSAVKVVESGAFGVVCVAGARFSEREARRVQLAAEETSAVVLALVDSYEGHPPWPSVLRLSLTRAPGVIHLRVSRERRGRIGQRVTLRAA